MSSREVIGICTATLLADPFGAQPDDVRAAAAGAAAAGFGHASVWVQHLDAVQGHGLEIRVVEAAMSWANADEREAHAEADRLAAAAERVGAAIVMAVCLEPTVADANVARRNLAALVERVASVGATVCVEFLPWSGIPTLAAAWDLVEPVGPSARLVLDTWHWVRQRGGPSPEVLARIPGDRIGYVQLCDAAAEPGDDVLAEAMTARLLPGDGVVDFAGVRAGLEAIGAAPFVATEVFNPAIVDDLGAEGAARTMRESAYEVS